MLHPANRSLYTDLLTPPSGMVFDEAIGTTFSLDPSILLSVPVHLALHGADGEFAASGGIAVLESLRRLAGRITVYAQKGRISVPTPPHVLYGLLESMLVEVSPDGGIFHPKLWLLRFTDPEEVDHIVLRLLVLSRNLTTDRSWDLVLAMDGRPSRRKQVGNKALAKLVTALPTLARSAHKGRRAQARRLGAELWRTEWLLPGDFQEVIFHVLGPGFGGWLPTESRRLAVISPFLHEHAVRELAGSTNSADTLVSRPESLEAIRAETLGLFEKVYTLDEAAEVEDGEANDDLGMQDTYGLHAKAYIYERGWQTHVVVGSANATRAALVAGRNFEVLAELIGKRSKVGGIDDLVGIGGFGDVLTPHSRGDPDGEADSLRDAAEKLLEKGRDQLSASVLRLKCARDSGTGNWGLELAGGIARLGQISEVHAWPITVPSSRAVALPVSGTAASVHLGLFSLSSVTGLVAFELRVATYDLRLRFVLNLPVDNLPEDRDAEILKTVVHNQEGFLRYLLMLLGGIDRKLLAEDGAAAGTGKSWLAGAVGGEPLLEEMVRAYSRDPGRLEDVAGLVNQLVRTQGAEAIVPQEFLDTWAVFNLALEKHRARK